MSGLFDKKAEGSTHRQARTQKEQKAKRKTRIVSVSVLSVLILVFVGALFVNSNFIRRTLPAITIGGIKFSAAEFDYFYYTSFFEYTEWVNQQFGDMADFASSMMPSRDLPHSAQVYDQETGATWADFFNGQAINQMSEIVKLYNAAKAAGFVISDETRANVDSQISSLLMEGEYYSSISPTTYPTAESYLKALYGGSMTEGTLRKVMEFVFTAFSYGENVRDSFVYSDDEIEAYYLDNSDDLDVFRYRMFLIRPETVYEEDFDSTEEYEEANDVLLAEAKETAERIALLIENEEDFIRAAFEHDMETYSEESSTLREHLGEQMDINYYTWLRDSPREYGDVGTIDMSFGSYVVFFIERDDNSYLTTAMRQLLFLRDSVEADDFFDGLDDPEYIEAFENSDAKARERAEEAYDLFVAGGATEQKLLELIEEGYTDDTSEGGFYEEMARYSYENQSDSRYAMRVVPEIERWLFESGRQIGDSALVPTEAYGYHLLYFMGHGQRFRNHIATDRMTARDYAQWSESLPDVEATKNWAFIFTQA